MAKKSKTTPQDALPTDDELDALQAEIDQVLDSAAASTADQAAKDDKGDNGAEDAPQSEAAARIAALEAELASAKDQALRAMAEAQNVNRRAEREVAQARQYGIERFAQDVLSTVDNLGRALSTVDGTTKADLGDNAKNLLDGIELTEKELMAVLARHGIKAVPGKDSKFDPNVHQAVAQIPSDIEKGNVAEVMQTGFTIGDRTLRAAMVAVSTGPMKT